MFGLFKKKEASYALNYQVYLNQISKYRMLMKQVNDLLENNTTVIIIHYFAETGNMLSELIKSSLLPDNKVTLIAADQLNDLMATHPSRSFEVIVAEVHPMAGRDQILYETICHNYPGTKIVFYTSTDGPLMQAFGGEKIHNMMLALGLDENEKVEHALVSKSIQRAQEKIKAKVQIEKPAFSKQEWMNKNVKQAQ